MLCMRHISKPGSIGRPFNRERTVARGFSHSLKRDENTSAAFGKEPGDMEAVTEYPGKNTYDISFRELFRVQRDMIFCNAQDSYRFRIISSSAISRSLSALTIEISFRFNSIMPSSRKWPSVLLTVSRYTPSMSAKS